MKSILYSFFLFAATFLLIISPQSAWGQLSHNISLIAHWQDTSVTNPYPTHYNEVWGFVQDGREYGVIGSVDGVYILDLDDPAHPVIADFIVGAFDLATHRDMHDHDGFLYLVADEGNSRFKVADLSFLPDSVHLVYDSNEHLATAHNIFIDSSRSVLYAFGAQDTIIGTYDHSVQAFSIANPAQPQPLGGYTDQGYAHDGFVRDDTVFINMWSDGLYMVDFTDPQNPVAVGQLPVYPVNQFIANHSGWLSPDKQTYLMADEWIGEEIKVVDVSDPSNISIISTFQSVTDPDSITPHNLIYDGRYAYISCYTDGLRIFDLIDLQNPVLTGFYDTYPGSNEFSLNGAWGVYTMLPSGLILVSDRNSGLYILDASPALAKDLPFSQALEVWPVPSKDKVKVKVPGDGLEWERIMLMDMQGRVVMEKEIEPGNASNLGNATSQGNASNPGNASIQVDATISGNAMTLEIELRELSPGGYLFLLEGKNGSNRIGKLIKR